MNYREKLGFIFTERTRLDSIVEAIVQLNGQGTLFREGSSAVHVERLGDRFQVEKGVGVFGALEDEKIAGT